MIKEKEKKDKHRSQKDTPARYATFAVRKENPQPYNSSNFLIPSSTAREHIVVFAMMNEERSQFSTPLVQNRSK